MTNLVCYQKPGDCLTLFPVYSFLRGRTLSILVTPTSRTFGRKGGCRVEPKLLQFVYVICMDFQKKISQTKMQTLLNSFNIGASEDFIKPEIQYRVHKNNIDSTFRLHAHSQFLYKSHYDVLFNFYTCVCIMFPYLQIVRMKL